jgi:hypothetical protein
LLVLAAAAMEVSMGAESIPDAALVFMAEVIEVAIVTFIEVAGMATVTTDIMVITATMVTTVTMGVIREQLLAWVF